MGRAQTQLFLTTQGTSLHEGSTHLGHACKKETCWYIKQHPDLMQQAMKPSGRRWKDTP
jgi:hypothetical protein